MHSITSLTQNNGIKTHRSDFVAPTLHYIPTVHWISYTILVQSNYNKILSSIITIFQSANYYTHCTVGTHCHYTCLAAKLANILFFGKC